MDHQSENQITLEQGKVRLQVSQTAFQPNIQNQHGYEFSPQVSVEFSIVMITRIMMMATTATRSYKYSQVLKQQCIRLA